MRRGTVFNLNGNGEPSVDGSSINRGPRYTTAVSMLLGGDVVERMRKEQSGGGKGRGEMNVEALLKGAEKLCRV